MIKLNTIQAIYSPVHPEHLAYIGTQFPMYYFDTQIVGNDSWKNLDILNQSNIGPHMEGLSIISSNYSTNLKVNSVQASIMAKGHIRMQMVNSGAVNG